MSAYNGHEESDNHAPRAIAAEEAVLGALMLSPKSLASISDWLSADDFFVARNQMIFKAISGLVEQKVGVDAITLTEWFEQNGLAEHLPGPGYLVELSNNTASAATIVSYAEIVVEKSRLRMAIATAQRMLSSALANGARPADVVGTALHDLSQMQSTRIRGGLVPVRAALVKLQQSRVERFGRQGSLLGLPTPWEELNKATKGLRDGQLYVLGARPNMGKSVGGVQIAAFTAARGERVAFFSVEMTDEQCMARAMACLGEIDHEWVEDPNVEVDDIEVADHRYVKTFGALLESEMLIDHSPGLTVEQFVARARRAHMQKPLRLVVLDHMHDMGLDTRREQRHEYGRIAQAGKTLAKEFGCAVILLAQLNRSVEGRQDKRPRMSDLREAGEIEQKADVILFLHREDYYEPSTPNKGVVEVIVGKGRDIKTGTIVYLSNQYHQMRLGDMEHGFHPAAPATKPGGGLRAVSNH